MVYSVTSVVTNPACIQSALDVLLSVLMCVCVTVVVDVSADKEHAAARASRGNSAGAKQPRLMTRKTEFTDGHSVTADAVSCMLMSSPFDHELGQVVNNSSAVLNKVASLCENDSLSDIELIVCCSDGSVTRRSFPAHKLILSCSSDVLRVMLMNPCWPDSSRPSIELHEESSCVPVSYIPSIYLRSCQAHNKPLFQ